MADILSWVAVVTRKPHKCFGCAKEYSPQSNMVRACYAQDGSASTEYWCETCIEYMKRYFEYGDETEYGGIYENDSETWEKLKQEMAVSTLQEIK